MLLRNDTRVNARHVGISYVLQFDNEVLFCTSSGMPPKFKQVPKKREMYKTGDTAKLHCHSEGDPHPNVEWFKDGESLGVKKRTSVEADGWTLNLRYLSVGDSGKYTCRVSNNVGTINRTFNIIVKGWFINHALQCCLIVESAGVSTGMQIGDVGARGSIAGGHNSINVQL